MIERMSCHSGRGSVIRVAIGLALVASAPLNGSGGDTCETALVIPALPFSATGDTSLFSNALAPACPFGSSSDSAAPDVVYRYTPQHDETVTISLCRSSYDTKLYVFEGSCAGPPVACSDDDCFGPSGRGFTSHLKSVALAAGSTYYIVIDGFKDQSGRYVLTIASSACAECVPDAVREDEPNCGLSEDGRVSDFTNGGCNSPVPVFTAIAAGQTFCGTVASDPTACARDTDWYELALTQETVVSWIVTAEFRCLVGIVENGGIPDCRGVSGFVIHTETAACQPSGVTAVLGPGTWWLYVAPFFQEKGECVLRYVATALARAPADLDGDGVVGELDLYILLASWGLGASAPNRSVADINRDGVIGVGDLLRVLNDLASPTERITRD